MKTIRTHLATLLAIFAFVSFGQTENPAQDTGHMSSGQEDSRGDGVDHASDTFCAGLSRILDASKEEGFVTVKGDMKRATNNSDTFFDQYFCKEHIDGMNDEVIEDLLFFIQYRGTVGSPAPLDVINKRFYEYKARMETCLPNFPERVSDENLNGLLKVEYEAEVDYEMHYLRLEVAFDPETSNHKLELVVEEVY